MGPARGPGPGGRGAGGRFKRNRGFVSSVQLRFSDAHPEGFMGSSCLAAWSGVEGRGGACTAVVHPSLSRSQQKRSVQAARDEKNNITRCHSQPDRFFFDFLTLHARRADVGGATCARGRYPYDCIHLLRLNLPIGGLTNKPFPESTGCIPLWPIGAACYFKNERCGLACLTVALTRCHIVLRTAHVRRVALHVRY